MKKTALALALLCAASVPSFAATCLPWNDLKKTAAEQYNETPTGGVGIVNDKLIIAVLASPGGDTWTMITIDGHGNACIIATGTNWLPVVLRPKPVAGERAS